MSNTPTRAAVSRRSLIGGALAVAGVAAAAPATVRAAGHTAAAPAPSGTGPEPPAETYFHVLPAPVRAYDSRNGETPDGTDPTTHANDTALVGGNSRMIDIAYALGSAAAATGVPTDATGVMFNLTITRTIGSGWLRVWGKDATEPNTSNINWGESGVTSANMGVSACADGYINVRCGPSSSALSTHFIIDVLGYYSAVFTGPP